MGDEFPTAVHMVSDEYEQVSGEALEDIGQVLLSIRTREDKADAACEALRRAKCKIPGRQKIHVSHNWGFTPFKKEDYEKYKAEGRLIPQGVHVQWLSSHGPLSRLIGRDAE